MYITTILDVLFLDKSTVQTTKAPKKEGYQFLFYSLYRKKLKTYRQ
jgi:hypothetical protein